MTAIRDAVKGIPGLDVEVDKESAGPPTDPPVNIEIAGDDFEWPGVKQAVTELLPDFTHFERIGCWAFFKSDK